MEKNINREAIKVNNKIKNFVFSKLFFLFFFHPWVKG